MNQRVAAILTAEQVAALKALAPSFREFAFEYGGVDWLAVDPDELWCAFLDGEQR